MKEIRLSIVAFEREIFFILFACCSQRITIVASRMQCLIRYSPIVWGILVCTMFRAILYEASCATSFWWANWPVELMQLAFREDYFLMKHSMLLSTWWLLGFILSWLKTLVQLRSKVSRKFCYLGAGVGQLVERFDGLVDVDSVARLQKLGLSKLFSSDT